ncbi:hypothetical protein J4G65_22165, partial [Aeromonas allosaccharophila]|uniref:hypothetical protein n=1 Tax=Aeromonas allosaccharophila TaxID=656 RepID=UPI001BCF6460
KRLLKTALRDNYLEKRRSCDDTITVSGSMGRYIGTDSGHEGESMSIQGSLRAQLLALLGGSIRVRA